MRFPPPERTGIGPRHFFPLLPPVVPLRPTSTCATSKTLRFNGRVTRQLIVRPVLVGLQDDRVEHRLQFFSPTVLGK
jgi:hypothetical protein